MGKGEEFKKKEENVLMMAALRLPKFMEVPAVTHFKNSHPGLVEKGTWFKKKKKENRRRGGKGMGQYVINLRRHKIS